MNVTKEAKKKEAIERLKMWGILKDAIDQFKNDDIIMECEPPVGAYYWLNDDQKARVAKFECEHNALVYFVIREFTDIGELEHYLYVSDYPEEWEQDREDIKAGYPLICCENLDMPDCSEFGTIGVKRTIAAGLHRIE